MTRPNWFEKARNIHHQFLVRAQETGHLKTQGEMPSFFALAIAGEAGELANLYKKVLRGDKIPMEEIGKEIADIRIYLEHLVTELGLDLDAACDAKLDEVQERLNRN